MIQNHVIIAFFFLMVFLLFRNRVVERALRLIHLTCFVKAQERGLHREAHHAGDEEKNNGMSDLNSQGVLGSVNLHYKNQGFTSLVGVK